MGEKNNSTLVDEVSEQNHRDVSVYFATFQHFVGKIGAAPPHIYGTFAGFDLKVLLKLTSDSFKASNKLFVGVYFALAELLRSILQEHKRPNPSETPHLLLKFITQLQEWILKQLQKLPLDGTTFNSYFNTKSLEIIFSDSELGFCWCLMSQTKLSDLFCDVELLGEFAMNGYKYSYLAVYCYHYLFNNLIEKWDHSAEDIATPVMDAAAFFLSKAAPRIDVCLSLHKIVGLDPMQEFKDLRQPSSLYDYRIRLVSYFEPHFRQNFHGLKQVVTPGPSPDSLMKLLVDYSVKTCREFPSLVGQVSAHVQDGRLNPASERKKSDSASTWCTTILAQPVEEKQDAPLQDERHSVPSQERQIVVEVEDERRTVQDTREHVFRPKSRSNSPTTNPSALQALPRKRYSKFESRIPVSKRRKQQK
ncbi:hypothetical protein BDZ97DRAFT_1929358 [Flammula alnicola]|nr:hypothetical protein BDZ97DRAFT_1929358 [Flammula alnicola]